jgi:carbamoyl-phosphate synthase large subunit
VAPPPAPYKHLSAAGVEVEQVNKVREGRPHIVDRILDGDIQIVINDHPGSGGHQGTPSRCGGPR